VDDVVAQVQRAAQSTPSGQWLIGRGSPLQDFRLKERRLPTREELDAAVPNHPAYLTFGAHVVVANSLALKLKGITRDTPSPQGGTVVKDPATGEPTGVLRERAQYLIKSKSPEVEPGLLAEQIVVELEKCARRGVTGIHDIVTCKEELLAYQQLAREGRLSVRVQLLIRVIESKFSKESLLDLGFLHGFGSDWLKIGGIKMSIDGGYTGKNAAFSRPLDLHGDENPGLIRITQDELDDTVWRYHEMGMRICTHAMGDAAVDMIMESYDKALARLPRNDHRHRVEHMGNWVMTPDRIARCKRLGVLPMSNPSFLYFFGDPSVEMLRERMTEQGYPFGSMWSAGIPVSFGSDAPGYFPIDPLRDLGTAAAHKTLSGATINAAERLTVAQALRCQTANAAYAGFMDGKLGTLEVGKLADVTVLDQDPFSFPPERFGELPIALTICGGRVTHRAGV
jgi:predicted amidohydrolase YtcJ